MATVSPTPKFQAFDANGAPLVGGKLYTYVAGTTTPQVTYTSSSGLVPNVNPVILDSRGEASVWLSSAEYKFVLKDAYDAEIWTVDNLAGSATQAELQALDVSLTAQIAAISSGLAGSSGASLVGYNQGGLGAVTQTVQTRLRKSVYVTDYGATGDGVTNDTAAFNLAISACPTGGTVLVPPGRYLIDPITLPAYKSMSGTTPGPFDGAYDPASVTNAPTILVNSNTGPAITLSGYQSSVTDLLFFYPTQVTPTSATPLAFNSTIYMTAAGGHNCRRCTFINSYVAIQVNVGRCNITDCLIGAYSRGILIDNALDWVTISNVSNQVMWDVYLGLAFPQNIDAWVLNNAYALEARRIDSLQVVNFSCFGRYAGLLFADSADATLSPRNGYGRLTNLDFDYVAFGVVAVSTNTGAGGYKITNMDLGANASGVGTAGQATLKSFAGGTVAPCVTWDVGSVRGIWAAGSTYPDFTAAGEVYVTNVYGINNIGVIASPAVPATTVGYKNNYGIDMRIVMVAGGGSITAVDVKSFSGGYAGTGLAGANCSYVLRANETIKVTYPGTLTWSWATL